MSWLSKLSSLIYPDPVETTEPKIYLYLPNYQGPIELKETPVTVKSVDALYSTMGTSSKFNIVYKLQQGDNLINIVKRINESTSASAYELIVLGYDTSYEQLCRYKQKFKSIKFYNNKDRTVTSECVTESIEESQAKLFTKLKTNPQKLKEVVIVGIDSPFEALYTITALEDAMKKGYGPIYFKETMNEELKEEINKLVLSHNYELSNEAQQRRKKQQQRQQRQRAALPEWQEKVRQHIPKMLVQTEEAQREEKQKAKRKEQAARKAQQARKAKQAEAKRKAQQQAEAKRKEEQQAEAKRKEEQQAEAKKAQQQARKAKQAEQAEARRKAQQQEEAKRKAQQQEEAKRKAQRQAEAKRKAQQQAKRKAQQAKQEARKAKQAQLTKGEFKPENWAMRIIKREFNNPFLFLNPRYSTTQPIKYERIVIYPKKLNGKELKPGKLVRYKPDQNDEFYYYIQDYDNENSVVTFERMWNGKNFEVYSPVSRIPLDKRKKGHFKAITSSNFLVPKEIANSIQ